MVSPAKVSVDVEQVGEPVAALLSEEGYSRRFWKPIRRAALVVAVGVDDRNAFARQQKGMRLFAVSTP